MKLQKLTIHNIASIEDAVIDFEAQPLADSEVFLITGKTGAGKSTILDAICLALYADTPRLKGTLMEGKAADFDSTIGVDDPRQLMRRNTGEAFVSLTFAGSNGTHYEATWRVKRAHNKPTKKLQGKTWSLKDIDKDYTYTKDTEIKSEIRGAVGLDFNQFCRTTLLAQGEFTRFLNSKDEEKAAILEKITGVDIYTKVGKKIFEVTGQKKLTWSDAQQKVAGTRTMTEEEIGAKKDEIAALDNMLECVKSDADKDRTKLNWINTDAELAKAVKTNTEEYVKAKSIVDSEGFKEKELLVKQWNDTIDARKWMAERMRAEQSKSSQLEALSALKSDYVAVLEGYAFSEQERKEIEANICDIEGFIESHKDKATVYDNVQAIAGYLNTMAECHDNIQTNQNSIAKDSKVLTEDLQPAFAKAQKDVNEAQTSLEKQEADLKRQEEELAKLHLGELRKQRDEANDFLRNIDTAHVHIEAYASEKRRREKDIKTIEDTLAEIEKKKKESEEMEQSLHDAKVKMKYSKEMLEKERDTIDKFAKALRQKLHVGDICPVCRQKITKDLPHEEELAKLVGTYQDAYNEAEATYKKLQDSKNKLDAEIHSLTRSYQSNKDRIDKDTSVETATRNVLDACNKCGLVTVDGDTLAALKSLKDKTENSLRALHANISEGEKKDNAIREQRKVIDELRKGTDKLKGIAQMALQAIANCEKKIAIAKEIVKTKTEEMKKAEEKAALYITGQWETDWQVAPKDFSKELNEQANIYQKNVKQKQSLDTRLAQIARDCQMVNDVVEDILQLMPEWKELEASNKTELPNLLNKTNEVKDNITTKQALLLQAEKTINVNTSHIEDFLTSHKDIDRERLTALNNYPQKDVVEINSLLDEERNKVLKKKTLMEEVLRNQDAHRKARPELKEEDTTESLQTHIREYDKRFAEISEKKGAINQELKVDENNKKLLGTLIEDADKKKADYEKWARLNQLIGDATGNKFRKIAQSYVLNSLIHSANSYMKTLTDRYTLKVAPGTFVISLEDAYQGYVSRAASTISGGESFLVSLSLALALSDIGQQLSVDTLFIDEGFGSLSGEPLQNAITTLRSLHNKSGRHVGIISHVQELRECIPVQIQVDQQGNNSNSKISVVDIFNQRSPL